VNCGIRSDTYSVNLGARKISVVLSVPLILCDTKHTKGVARVSARKNISIVLGLSCQCGF
jgi:hypothetical protein